MYVRLRLFAEPSQHVDLIDQLALEIGVGNILVTRESHILALARLGRRPH
jgi:hypothetical protein